MDKILRQWIVNIIRQNESIIRIALRQRAKFEGWLKFEIAALAESSGATNVEVETPSNNGLTKERADFSFIYSDEKYSVELKTPNTNWRMTGVVKVTRPITENVSKIVRDVIKLKKSANNGLVAFVMFPVPPNDDQWKKYIRRIASETQLSVTPEDNCESVNVPLGDKSYADLIVCVFPV
jgi:hypothetical protein